MEAIAIKAIVRELSALCVPGRVRAVTQRSARDVVITVGRGKRPCIFLSADPTHPSLYAVSRRGTARASPTAFCRLLRKQLAGLVLTGIESPGMERSVDFHFAPGGGKKSSRRLVLEIMGRWSNIVLVDEASGLIADCLHHVPSPADGGRVMAPGEPYLPPPDGGRAHLDEVSPSRFRELFRAGRRDLPSRLVGLGPGLLALASGRARAGGGEGSADSLLEALRFFIAKARGGDLAPVLYPERRKVMPFPVPEWGGEEGRPFENLSDAAEELDRSVFQKEERERLAALLRRSLAKRHKRLRGRRERLALEAGGEAEERKLRQSAEAILASLRETPRGAESAELPDPRSPEGERITVALDPALTPEKNAEKYFRRARKAKRRAEFARARLPGLEEELARIEAQIAAMERLTLDELRERAGNLPGARGRKKPSRRKAGARSSKIREYRSADGWRILVGKSAAGNDELTSRVADPEDTWMHTRDVPGAHVVLKAPVKGGEVPEAMLRAAAEAAAWHSAARSEKMADVAYTLRKRVRKVKGQPPGRVLVPDSRTVRVRPGIPVGFRESGGGDPW